MGQDDVCTQARVKHVRARRGEQKRVYCVADMAELPSHSPSSSFHYLPSPPLYELILLDFYDITYPHLARAPKFIGL